MDRDESDVTAPSETWLFAQAILGNPVPRIASPEATAKAKRAELERFARSSPRHAEALRALDAAEAKARRDRELLEWAAGISTRAAEELRALQRKEELEREAWRRDERFYETLGADFVEWNETDHPRHPKGTTVGGQFAPKGGGGSAPAAAQRDQHPTTDRQTAQVDPKSRHALDFERTHDLTLRDALKKGKLIPGDVVRTRFSDDEVKQILKSVDPSKTDFNLTFYTAENLPPRLRATAERDFADLPGNEKYAMQAFISNQRRVRSILISRNSAVQKYVFDLYDLLRSLNPAHYVVEKGVVVATGREPVLGVEASRLNAIKDLLIYLAILKGGGWVANRLLSLAVAPEAAGPITLTFKGGGRVTIRRGADISRDNLSNAVERAAKGESVTIDPPAPGPATRLPSVEPPPPHRATVGRASTVNYRKTFFDAFPELQGKVIVHHGIEQQVLTRYPGVISEFELHSLENLRGIPRGINSETHLRAIRKEWNAFYDTHPTATKTELLDKVTEIDLKYGHLFDPPIR